MSDMSYVSMSYRDYGGRISDDDDDGSQTLDVRHEVSSSGSDQLPNEMTNIIMITSQVIRKDEVVDAVSDRVC